VKSSRCALTAYLACCRHDDLYLTALVEDRASEKLIGTVGQCGNAGNTVTVFGQCLMERYVDELGRMRRQAPVPGDSDEHHLIVCGVSDQPRPAT
jgi:hypothetical protein